MGMGISNITKTPILILFLAVGFFVGISFSSVYAGIPWGTDDIADDAITSDKIKNKAVKNADIRNNQIKSSKIRDGTIQGEDIDSTTAITAGDFSYSNSQTRTIIISAAEFSGAFDTDWDLHVNGAFGSISTGSADKFVFAPVYNIPDGASINKLECIVKDNDATDDVNCALARTIGTTTSVAVGSFTSSGDDPAIQTIGGLIPTHVVDTDTNSYFIRFFPESSSCGSKCQLYLVKITYTVPKPD